LERIKFHEEKAKWADGEAKRLEPEAEKFRDQAQSMGKTGRSNNVTSALSNFKNEYQRHNDKVTLFTFMADHIIPNETYILDENDLRKLEVLPQYDY
jgi:hypothetical protein